ncbi:hypothetical protein, partial [Thiolapillus sp.]|uniref:hypothetical protein n=1 Tax=Thiolapillus sp. TaxID=2017437 RepID=UPI003AF41828
VPQPSWSPSTTQQLRKLVAAPYLAPNDWTPRSEAYFVFPLTQGTPGKQCGLAATGVYQPSLRSPWLAATVMVINLPAFLFGNQQGYTRQWLVGIVETVEQPVRDGSGGYRGRGKLPQPTVQIRQCSGITAVEMGVGANTDHDGMGGRLTAVDQGLIAKGQRVIHGPAHPGMGAVQAQPGTGRI